MADLDRIKAKCTEAEAEELAVYLTAVERTLAAYQDGYAEADLRKWNAAKGAMAEFIAALEAKYFPAERCHPHRNAALEWLQEQGYKIKKSKFYNDCAAGRCVIEGDGTVRESALLAYAAEHLKRIQDENGNLTPLTEEKTRLEIEKLQKQNERAEFELEKERRKYIKRRDFNLEISARAGVLDQGVQNFFRTRTPDWVARVGGDPKKVSMVMDMVMAEWNELLAEYASLEQFHVVFEEEN